MPQKRRRNTAEEAESPNAFASAAALASLSLQVQQMKAGWIKSFVALEASVRTQQSRCEISSCAGSLESAKTELTKKMDAKVDALEEKIQGLKKGAEDLEEDHTEEDHTEGPWVESLSLKEQQKCVHQGKITWGAAVREYPDKIAVWLLSRRIGTITKQELKKGSEALKGIGVTGGLNNDTAGILWSKLNPGDDDL
jgi:hypothetical protein